MRIETSLKDHPSSLLPSVFIP